MRNKKEEEDSFSYVVGRRRAREGERGVRGESTGETDGGKEKEEERTSEEEIMRRQECTPTFTTCFPTYVCGGHHVRTRWRAHVECTVVHTSRNGQLWTPLILPAALTPLWQNCPPRSRDFVPDVNWRIEAGARVAGHLRFQINLHRRLIGD